MSKILYKFVPIEKRLRDQIKFKVQEWIAAALDRHLDRLTSRRILDALWLKKL